jgi:hypothetical protein
MENEAVVFDIEVSWFIYWQKTMAEDLKQTTDITWGVTVVLKIH